jgi:glycosyltransferase involved in cell wall biosynthesis
VTFQPSLTVVVPAFNERDNLGRVLAELCAELKQHAREFEVLVVDDGSTDGSADAVPRAPELRTLAHDRNRGLTAALRTGFFGARGEYVTWVPADGQIPAVELCRVLDAFAGEDLWLTTYRRRADGLRRAVLSRGLRVLARVAIGLTDRLEGTYLFRRALLDELHVVADRSAGGIAFEIAAKARARGKRIGSLEIECAPRLSGSSKVVRARAIWSTLVELWQIRRSMRRKV